MVIRKRFTFEGSHIVRNCSSERCKYSIHGHSYKVEIFITSDKLDNGQMIYDFGLMKGLMKSFIDTFDHTFLIWNQDQEEYIEFASKFSARYIIMPISSSAEILSLLFLKACTFILGQTEFNNNEGNVKIASVRIHETETGYAESFADDLNNKNFPDFDLENIKFSDQIISEWKDYKLWQSLLKGETKIQNPKVHIQVI